MPTEQVTRIIAALSTPESPIRRKGAGLFVDHLLRAPISDFINPEALHELIVSALQTPIVQRVIETHSLPAWTRHEERCEAAGETLGRAIPPEARSLLYELLIRTDGPRGAWLRDAIDPKLVRQLLAPVIQEVLSSFAKRLPLPGSSERSSSSNERRSNAFSGLRARVKRRAERVVDAGKNVMGSVGAELERKFQKAARDFSQSAVGEARTAFEARIESKEGLNILGKIARQLIDTTLDTPLSVIHKDFSNVPQEELLLLLPSILAHNAKREWIATALRQEIRHYLDAEGSNSVGDWLSEGNETGALLETTRSALTQQLDSASRPLFRDPRFADWLGELLEVPAPAEQGEDDVEESGSAGSENAESH